MTNTDTDDALYCPDCNNKLKVVSNTEISNKEDVKGVMLFCEQCQKPVSNDEAKLKST
jgi:uncharacterized protein YbaR (Trm112 family)